MKINLTCMEFSRKDKSPILYLSKKPYLFESTEELCGFKFTLRSKVDYVLPPTRKKEITLSKLGGMILDIRINNEAVYVPDPPGAVTIKVLDIVNRDTPDEVVIVKVIVK